MDIEVKKFVEAYNQRMSWNRDILNELNINIYQSDKYLQTFMKENLSIQNITEERIDLEHAKIYSYDDGTLEMQAFNNETYNTTYFWIKPNENENTYKSNRISQIIKELDEEIYDVKEKISKLTSKFNSIVNFRNNFLK